MSFNAANNARSFASFDASKEAIVERIKELQAAIAEVAGDPAAHKLLRNTWVSTYQKARKQADDTAARKAWSRYSKADPEKGTQSDADRAAKAKGKRSPQMSGSTSRGGAMPMDVAQPGRGIPDSYTEAADTAAWVKGVRTLLRGAYNANAPLTKEQFHEIDNALVTFLEELEATAKQQARPLAA